MMRRLFIPVACVATWCVTTSLTLAAPVRGPIGAALAEPAGDELGGRTGDLCLPDTFNASGVARLRRRGATLADRCYRSGRHGSSTRSPGPRRVVTEEQVALGGCRYFLEHGTLDMDGLALSLNISRATLYRVAQSRDQLLADVLWRLAERGLSHARKGRTRQGVEGVLEVGRRFSALLLKATPFQRFLVAEPETAARILLTANGGLHSRAVEAQKEIFLEAAPPSGAWPSGDLDNIAYLLVRIFESVWYAELLAHRRPDRQLAERAIRALLPE
jgi:AcrR family transcriptional regulator